MFEPSGYRQEATRALSPPHHYVALEGDQRVFVCLRIQGTRAQTNWASEHDVSFAFAPLSISSQHGVESAREAHGGSTHPHLRAVFCARQKLIHIEAIDKGFLLKGQRFTSSTLSQLRALAPAATSVVLANVLHGQTRELLLKSLPGKERGAPLDEMGDPGPLIKGLLRAGCFHITARQQSKQAAYIDLVASCLPLDPPAQTPPYQTYTAPQAPAVRGKR